MEGALRGCIPLLSSLGNGGNTKDFPLPPPLRIEDPFDAREIAKKIENVVNNYGVL